MTNSFKLTRKNFLKVKNKYENRHHKNFECASENCHKPFKIGDVIVYVGKANRRYFHKECLQAMRV